MDYEKKYKEALEKAEKELQACGSTDCDAARQIFRFFPELKESEDERIKHEIKVILANTDFSRFALDYTFADMIAWLEKQAFNVYNANKEYWRGYREGKQEILDKYAELEKQGKQKPYKPYSQMEKCLNCQFNYAGYCNGTCILKNNKQKPAFEMKTPEESLGIDFDTYNKIVDECIYGEQKPAETEKGAKGNDREIPLSEQPIIIIPKFRVGDEIKTYNEEPLTITKIDKKGYWSNDLFICDFDEECIWDLVGQKHVDKVEPKFKVCDWVVRGDTIAQILDIQEQYYVGLDINGKDFTSSRFLNDDKIHLWTIQDAKDGDVLAVEPIEGYSSSFVAIYKKQNEEDFDSYCFVGFDGKFYNGENGHSAENIHPATKGQRDTLIKAMADAGYTFDFEKKELKKIEQKHIECSEDNLPEFESYLCLMFQKFRTKGVCTNGEIVDFVKEHSQKLKDTLCHVWSEEDEHRLEDIIYFLDTAKKHYASTVELDACIDWLKSLRPQNRWKPSDEHYELEEFAKIVRSNLTGISKAVQELFEAKYLQLTGNKMYGGFKD